MAKDMRAGFGDDGLRAAADVMRQVRDRCVWSQHMTHDALLPYLIEEAHELIDAVEQGDREEMREELGDLLWQVLFHAVVAADAPDAPFTIDDVAWGLVDKMVRRHPHVFAGETATTPEEVLVHWNAAKAAEKRQRRSVLDGVPASMPALARAQKLIGRAARADVTVAPHGSPMPATEAELGETLLALVAQARTRGWDAERALRARLRMLENDVRLAEADTDSHTAVTTDGAVGEASGS